jgi:3-phenylpropionate/trans-cinnamate dioxygenase ferredoxin component
LELYKGGPGVGGREPSGPSFSDSSIAASHYNVIRHCKGDYGMNFKEICKADQIPAGTMKGIEIDGNYILVSNIGGKYYAIHGKCTHLGGDLVKGKLEGSVVTCPRHGSKFDVTTGKTTNGPKIGFLKLNTKDEKTYPVKIDGQSVMVDLG